ncbi:MAG: MFS transporter [Myxococcota bacterium]|nr:MFS transporter [Myxococcota bacterium]
MSGAHSMWLLFVVVLIDMIGFTLVIPFLPYFIQDLAEAEGIVTMGNRDLWVGLTIGVYAFAQFLMTPVLGSISDRFGRRPVLLLGLVGNSIFFIVFGLADTLWLAFTARFLAGCANGNIAVARAYVGDISDHGQLARRMGLIGAAFGLGFMIGPFLGGILADPAGSMGGIFVTPFWQSNPYFLPCLLSAALSTLALLLALKHLPESLPPEKRSPGGSYSGHSLLHIFRGTFDIWRLPQIAPLIATGFLFMWGFSILHGVFVIFTALDTGSGGLGFTERQNGWVFAYVGLVIVLVQGGAIGPLADRFGNRRLMVCGIVTAAVGLSSIPYVPGALPWLVLLSSTAISIGNGLFSPTHAALLASEAKAAGHDLGKIMGAKEGYGALARVLGPVTGGLVWKYTVEGAAPWSYHTAFRLCALFMALTFVCQLFLARPSGSGPTVAPEAS